MIDKKGEESDDMQRHSEDIEIRVRKDKGCAYLRRVSRIFLTIPAEDWDDMESYSVVSA